MGKKGRRQPCYCWQEVAPFFPDGETEAQGSLGTCPRSLTVSQLWGRGWGTANTLGNLVTFLLGQTGRPLGCLEGTLNLSKGNGDGSLLGTGLGQVQ
jgi:hypothetical protein